MKVAKTMKGGLLGENRQKLLRIQDWTDSCLLDHLTVSETFRQTASEQFLWLWLWHVSRQMPVALWQTAVLHVLALNNAQLHYQLDRIIAILVSSGAFTSHALHQHIEFAHWNIVTVCRDSELSPIKCSMKHKYKPTLQLWMLPCSKWSTLAFIDLLFYIGWSLLGQQLKCNSPFLSGWPCSYVSRYRRRAAALMHTSTSTCIAVCKV